MNSPDFRPWTPLERCLLALLGLMLVVGVGGFVAGMLAEQIDHVALPMIMLMLAAIVGIIFLGLLRLKGIFVSKSLFRVERQWRTREEAPFRYWGFVVLMAMCFVGFLVNAVVVFIDPSVLDRPTAPPGTGHATLWLLVLMLPPGLASVFCLLKAYRHLKPESAHRMGKLLLPRHVAPAGLRWLIGYYLGVFAFILLICLSPLIIPWPNK